MKLTDEQCSEAVKAQCHARTDHESVRAVADYLAPIFAAEMLGPVTDRESTFAGTARDMRGMMFSLNEFLASRRAKYAPKADPAVEAVRNALGHVLCKNGCADAEMIVAAVREADAKAGRKEGL